MAKKAPLVSLILILFATLMAPVQSAHADINDLETNVLSSEKETTFWLDTNFNPNYAKTPVRYVVIVTVVGIQGVTNSGVTPANDVLPNAVSCDVTSGNTKVKLVIDHYKNNYVLLPSVDSYIKVNCPKVPGGHDYTYLAYGDKFDPKNDRHRSSNTYFDGDFDIYSFNAKANTDYLLVLSKFGSFQNSWAGCEVFDSQFKSFFKFKLLDITPLPIRRFKDEKMTLACNWKGESGTLRAKLFGFSTKAPASNKIQISPKEITGFGFDAKKGTAITLTTTVDKDVTWSEISSPSSINHKSEKTPEGRTFNSDELASTYDQKGFYLATLAPESKVQTPSNIEFTLKGSNPVALLDLTSDLELSMQIGHGLFYDTVVVNAPTQSSKTTKATPSPKVSNKKVTPTPSPKTSTKKVTPTPKATVKTSTSPTPTRKPMGTINGTDLSSFKFAPKASNSMFAVRLKNGDYQISWLQDYAVNSYDLYIGDFQKADGKSVFAFDDEQNVYFGNYGFTAPYFPSAVLTYKKGDQYRCATKDCDKYGDGSDGLIFYRNIPKDLIKKYPESSILLVRHLNGGGGYYSFSSIINVQAAGSGFMYSNWMCQVSAYGKPIAEMTQSVTKIALSQIGKIPGGQVANVGAFAIDYIGATVNRDYPELGKSSFEMGLDITLDPDTFKNMTDEEILNKDVYSVIDESVKKSGSISIKGNKVAIQKVLKSEPKPELKKYLDKLSAARKAKDVKLFRSILRDSAAMKAFSTASLGVSYIADGVEVVNLFKTALEAKSKTSEALANCNY